MRLSVCVIPAFFAFASLAMAQGESVFRSTTQLIQIDVAAQDKNGHPITDLTKDDFQLIFNRKPQPIDTFTATLDAPVPPMRLPPGTFSNQQTATEISHGRYTVFLLDWRNTNWQLQSWSHQQLLKMVSATPPENKVALYLIDNGFQIVQEFTSDHELLIEKAAALRGEVPPPLITLDQAEAAASETVTAFQDIAKHLAGISGQKVLIWISNGFPDTTPAEPPAPGAGPVRITDSNSSPTPSFLQDIDKAVHILGNANIVVESAQATYLGASVLAGVGPTRSYVNTLQQIAERTGGRFFPGDTNDLATTLRTAANDRATSYEIGFYTSGDLPLGLQPFEIRCRRPGITLRYREGYFVEKNPPAAPPDSRAVAQDVLKRAVDAVTIPLIAKATHTMGNVPSIILRLSIDAASVTLKPDGDLWRGKISVFARFASDNEDQVGDIPLDAQPLNLTQEQHARALRDGVMLHFTMKMPARAAALRVLVRDDASGNVGTITVPVTDLPEF